MVGDRVLVGQPEHLVDDPVVRHAEPQRQPTLAHGLDRQRLLRERDRMARLHGHDRGADLDAIGHRAHERRRGERVEVVGDLRDPDRREPGLLGPSGVRLQPLDLRAVPAALRAEHHSDAHRSSPSVRERCSR